MSTSKQLTVNSKQPEQIFAVYLGTIALLFTVCC
jgi:hypothetical protein